MSLSDEEIAEFWMYRKNIHDGDLMLQLRDFARAIERAATIAAMRRCAEICDERVDLHADEGGSAYCCDQAIRAEIARLEEEK